MPKGYWIAHVSVKDAENYPQYITAAQPAYEKYGATFIVRGGRSTAPEGEARDRHVVVEFDSYQKALDCYNSPEYQEAAKHRHAFADSDIVIVEGHDG